MERIVIHILAVSCAVILSLYGTAAQDIVSKGFPDADFHTLDQDDRSAADSAFGTGKDSAS